MDELDISIIEHLQANGRKRYTEIAQDLSVTEGTVRNRVNKLVDNNALQITGLINPQKLGFHSPAIIGVSITPPHLEEAAATIAEMPEVGYLIMVSGEYDLIVEVFCHDREHLATYIRDQLQQVVGVQSTKTFVILHTYKMSQGTNFIVSEQTSGQS